MTDPQTPESSTPRAPQPIDPEKLIPRLEKAGLNGMLRDLRNGDFDLYLDGWRMVHVLNGFLYRHGRPVLTSEQAREAVQATMDAGFDKPAPKLDFQNETIARALHGIMIVSKGGFGPARITIAEGGALQDAVQTLRRELGIEMIEPDDEAHFQGNEGHRAEQLALVQQGRAFRGQSDQYAELITELADALAEAIDADDDPRAGQDFDYVAQAEGWQDFRRRAERALTEIYQMLPGNEHLSIQDNPQQVVDAVREHLAAQTLQTEAQFALAFAARRRPRFGEGERAYDERIGDELNRLAQAELDRIRQDEPDMTIAEAHERMRTLRSGTFAAEEPDLPEGYVPPENLAPFLKRRLRKATLRYAATALESSADNGDRYEAARIREALGEAVKTPEDYAADEQEVKPYTLAGFDFEAAQQRVDDARLAAEGLAERHPQPEPPAEPGSLREKLERALASILWVEDVTPGIGDQGEYLVDPRTAATAVLRAARQYAGLQEDSVQSFELSIVLDRLDQKWAVYGAQLAKGTGSTPQIAIPRRQYNGEGHPRRLSATIRYEETDR